MLTAFCSACGSQLLMADLAAGFICPQCGTNHPPQPVAPKSPTAQRSTGEFRRLWAEVNRRVTEDKGRS
jgi:hypothetical protein